jgi:hypothetical protein
MRLCNVARGRRRAAQLQAVGRRTASVDEFRVVGIVEHVLAVSRVTTAR